jgi:4-hydroxy-3-polyprenylbenzoate decarboxylase
MRLIVGISGASGSPYAARLLDYLKTEGETLGVETHLIFSTNGRLCWNHEVGTDPETLGMPIHKARDMTAAIASGSSRFDAMVVLPCSVGQLGRIASGTSTDLIGRAADVMLKQRRPLLLVLRESPLSLIHCRNMVTVTEAGAIVQPASPSFYSKPSSIEALIDTVVCRSLDLLGIDNSLMPRWTGQEIRR